MARSVLLALGTAAVAASAMSSCSGGPGREDVAIQRLGTLMCEKQLECDCSALLAGLCGDWPIEVEFGFDLEAPDRAFDEGCLPRWFDWLDTVECRAPVVPSHTQLCPLYHGTIREGVACQPVANPLLESECGPGLVCAAGTCRDPLQTAFGEAGQPCDFLDLCVEGTECHEGTCKPLPGPGEPCLDSSCSDTAECRQDLCVALPQAGEPCPSGSCAPGAFCDVDLTTGLGQCEHLGDHGDLCMGHRQCESGNCPAGICAPPADPGDPCSNTQPCGPDQFCFDGVCQTVDPNATPVTSVCEMLDSVLRPSG